MAPEVPPDRKAAFIWAIECRNGHEWFTYGEIEVHFDPGLCRVLRCGETQFSAQRVRRLSTVESANLRKYRVSIEGRRATYDDTDVPVEENVDAEGVRDTQGYWEFFVGGTVVERIRKDWVVGAPKLMVDRESQ
jgi:hypothetical protein